MSTLVPFPQACEIEGVTVVGFPNAQSLFERVVLETQQPRQTVIHYLNAHVANTAFHNARLKNILQKAPLVYCDGAGVMLASRMLGRGDVLPIRLPAADWFLDMIAYMAEANCRVFLLGGEPGVPEKALEIINEKIPNHTVVGVHHGFILNAPEVEQRLINHINELQPDLLIVGFGTPLQEEWVEEHGHKLKVSTIHALGAVMDYLVGKVSRCPKWMGDAGMEWLYRLFLEPGRLMGRYVVGNPWFLARITVQAVGLHLGNLLAGLKLKPSTSN